MTVRRVLISIIVIAALVAGGYWAYQSYLAPQPETAVATPGADTLTVDTGVDLVSAEGVVVPLRQAALAFQTGGRVAEVLVVEGESVEAGQPLVRLEAAELEVAVRQAQAAVVQAEAGVTAAEAQASAAEAGLLVAGTAVTAAEANLALVQADPQPEEIAALESNIAAAEAAIAQADANRDVVVSDPTAAQLEAAQAQIAAAQAQEAPIQDQYDQIIENELGGPVEEQTRFALNAAEANIRAAQAALDGLREGATAAQRRAANAGVAVAAAQRDAAQSQLDLLQAGARQEQVAVTEVEVERAEAAIAQAEAVVAQAEAAVAQAEANLVQAQAGVDAAQATLDRMTLTAPFAGTAADVIARVGEVISPGIAAVVLADFGGWQVETTDLTELDIVAVAVGYAVDVRIDAIPDETIPGTVTDIAEVSSLTRGDVTYMVTIDLQETADLPLRWGMTAFVDIDVGE